MPTREAYENIPQSADGVTGRCVSRSRRAKVVGVLVGLVTIIV